MVVSRLEADLRSNIRNCRNERSAFQDEARQRCPVGVPCEARTLSSSGTIFKISALPLVKNLMAGKTIDEQIRLFEEMAAHPDKTYAAENGNLQKIKVKDYYNKKQTSLDTKALFSIKSEKNFSA